jgi:predicted double-glycine peptidase
MAGRKRTGPILGGGISVALSFLAAACTAGLPIEPVTSLVTLNYAEVVRQDRDFSCGAAALATILNFYFGERYSEQDLLDILAARYDPAAWKKRQATGLSLEDLAYVAGKVGYSAEGALIGISGLLQIEGPVIVHLRKGTFEHFSAFRGTKDGAILLADPILGQVQYSPATFRAQYTGMAMAVWKEGDDLPEAYALMVGDRDSRHQLDHARNLLNAEVEPHQLR